MHTIQNNFTTAYMCFAVEHAYEDDEGDTPPCVYDYICDVEETPLDCETPEELNAVLSTLLSAMPACIWHMPDVSEASGA